MAVGVEDHRNLASVPVGTSLAGRSSVRLGPSSRDAVAAPPVRSTAASPRPTRRSRGSHHRIRGAGSSRQEPSSDGRRRRGRRAGQRRLGLWTPRSPDEGRLPLGGRGLGVQGGSNLYWEAERWKSSPTRSFHLVSRRFGARDAPARAAAGRTFVQPGRCPMHGGCANRAGTAGTSNTDDSTRSTRSPAKGAAPGREVTASRSCKPASRVSAPTTWSVRSAERTGLERRASAPVNGLRGSSKWRECRQWELSPIPGQAPMSGPAVDEPTQARRGVRLVWSLFGVAARRDTRSMLRRRTSRAAIENAVLRGALESCSAWSNGLPPRSASWF